MPIVNINILKGKSAGYKKTVLDCIHAALVKTIGIEDWDRFQRITEYDKDDFEFPSFKTDDFMIIARIESLILEKGQEDALERAEAYVEAGADGIMIHSRKKEQKGLLIEEITSSLKSSLSVEPSDVFIVFDEPPLENWGLGGKQKG